jgi:hypothetical protein
MLPILNSITGHQNMFLLVLLWGLCFNYDHPWDIYHHNVASRCGRADAIAAYHGHPRLLSVGKQGDVYG